MTVYKTVAIRPHIYLLIEGPVINLKSDNSQNQSFIFKKINLLLISGKFSLLQPVVQLHNTISTYLLGRLAKPNSFVFV